MPSLGKLTVDLELYGQSHFTTGFDRAARSVDVAAKSIQGYGKLLGQMQRAEAAATRERERATKAAEASAAANQKAAASTRAVVAALAAGAAYKAVYMLKDAFDAAAEGARNMAAGAFFAQAGKDINDLRKATNGMISDATLMKKANLADSMGISTATFKTLAQVAQAAALKTGQSFEYMFDSIITGTARSSRLLLDNLGIIVSVDVANRRYAESQLKAAGAKDISTTAVNKFVAAMDDEAKKVAFANEVMLQSNGTVGEFNKLGETSAARFEKFSASVDNFKDAIKALLAEAFDPLLPQMTSLVDELRQMAAGLDRIAGIDVAQGSALGALLGMATGGPLGALLGLGGGAIGGGLASASNGGFNKAQEKANADASMEGVMTSLLKQFREANPAMATADREAKLQFVANMTDAQLESLRKLDKPYADLIDALRQTAKFLHILPDAAKTGGGGGGLSTSGGGRSQTLRQQVMGGEWAKSAMKLAENARKNSDAYLKAEHQEGLDRAKAIHEGNQAAQQAFEEHLQGMEDVLQEDVDRWKRIATENDERNAAAGSAASSIGGAVTSGSGLLGVIGTMIGPGIGEAVSGALGAGFGPLGAVIGALVPIVMSLIDKLGPVVTLLGALADGITLLVGNALTELLGFLTSLAEPVRVLLAAVGLLIGSILRGVVPILDMVGVGLAYFIQGIAWAIIVISPFVELIADVLWTIISSGLTLVPVLLEMLSAFFGINMSVQDFVGTLAYGMDIILDGAIALNNGFVKFIRSLPGMKKFGKLLDKNDFEIEATEANTQATKDNTQATKDLAAEFRNLPQGYRVAGAQFSATAPVHQPGMADRFTMPRWRF